MTHLETAPKAGVLLLLAAGFARRMRGADKLLEEVRGQPVLRLLAQRGLEAGLDLRVCVPNLMHRRSIALQGIDLEFISVDDASEGMAASLRAGVADLDAPFVLVLPGDMPEIDTADLRAMAAARGEIVQATDADGTPGHPVRFDRRFFAEFADLTGDTGAKPILQRHRDKLRFCALPGRHATTDLDTPEEWAAWRAGQAAR